jgi:transglutaminase-like putative cysteine protease
MLAAGMCRAVGVPSRTALGLVYAPDRSGKPFLAYHMWFEVYADGHWVALDATLGRGSIGPGHVKIADASWHDEKSFAPLLPVLTVLGSTPKFEVLKVTEGRR